MTIAPAPPAIPCGDCLHARVCGKRETIEGLAGPEVIEHAPGLRLVITRTAECDDYLAPTFEQRALEARVVALVPEPEPIRREHGGESWRTDQAPKEATAKRRSDPPSQESRQRGAAVSSAVYAARRATKDAQAIAQLREHGGNAEAVGRAMGVTGAAVKQWIARMAAADTLPADVAELVAARGRKKPAEAAS